MKIDVYQLLFPLLREDSNEAAEAIANLYGRGLFVRHMNEKAKAIGMLNTHFVDPTGTEEGNVSTTEDLFMLAKYIYNNRSFLFDITRGKAKTNTYGKSIFNDLGDSNEFYGMDTFVGGVSARAGTESGYNFSVFELPLNNSVRPIFFLSFNSKDTKSDITGAMGYVKERYK
jgi:D-alanyl-D-alanine carboxypeptidase